MSNIPEHIILVGTENQIDTSYTLSLITADAMTHETSLAIMQLHNTAATIAQLFHPSKFIVGTKTVLVYTNGMPFSFTDFFIHHATNTVLHSINFVFIVAKNPFTQTTEITKRFKIINVANENRLIPYRTQKQTTISLDAKIKEILANIAALHAAKNFSFREKQSLLNIYKHFLENTNAQRNALVNANYRDIISQIQ